MFSGAGGLARLLAGRGIKVIEAASSDEIAGRSPARGLDCVIFTPSEAEIEDLYGAIGHAEPLLQPNGLMLFYLPEDAAADDIDAALAGVGLKRYAARGPRLVSRYTIIAQHAKCVDPTDGKGFMAVRNDYDSVKHAQALFDAGHPEWAFYVLDTVPADMLADPVVQLLVAIEMQLCLLAWKADVYPRDRLVRFYWAQQQFYRILNLHPKHPGTYICQATFWELLGDNGMAHRLLRSISHVAPDESITRRSAAIPAKKTDYGYDETMPAWDDAFRPRILIITHANSDCGIDALYDGLCNVLGSENVVEFPWKHHLHGRPIDKEIWHPTSCNHPGQPKSVEGLEEELRQGLFDVILFADTLELTEKSDTLRLVHANPLIPLFLADVQDEGFDNLPRILEHLRRDSVCAQFKREMLACASYSPNTYPLPLAYMDSQTAQDISGERTRPVFWAGHRCWGLRRIYLDHLEARFGVSLDELFPPNEFTVALRESQIGLDFFGLGYDTVRYWEIPAHGCMLLAERKPMRIPFNYVDGESAVFFDDLPELEQKLEYYLNHPDEARAIAVNGHEHMRNHHTSTARARQFLARVQEVLNRDP